MKRKLGGGERATKRRDIFFLRDRHRRKYIKKKIKGREWKNWVDERNRRERRERREGSGGEWRAPTAAPTPVTASSSDARPIARDTLCPPDEITLRNRFFFIRGNSQVPYIYIYTRFLDVRVPTRRGDTRAGRSATDVNGGSIRADLERRKTASRPVYTQSPDKTGLALGE